ncbi:MAG: GNAT family N-acetyltransferase [Bacteroidia bacterium]
MTLHTQLLTRQEAQQHEAFLLQTPDALLYHSHNYLWHLEHYLDAGFFVAIALHENKCVGYWPLALSKSGSFGKVANSLPYYGSNGAPVIQQGISGLEKEEILSALLKQILEKVEVEKCATYTVVTNPLDAETAQWLEKNMLYELTDDRIGQLTPLPKEETGIAEKLMQSFDDPRPRNIRKALKEGIRVRYSHTTEDRDFLYAVHRENIMAIGGIAKEKRFFDSLPEHFSEKQYRIYIAEKDGERIAGLLLFYYNQTVEYFTPGVVEAHRNTQPTALLVYQAMLDAIADKFVWWNWGGTWLSQGGVYDFKKKWGTRDLPYRYFTRVYDGRVRETNKETLLREYPNFYVVPFGILKSV